MITTQLNPGWLEPAAYIEFLNGGFPGQWDRASLNFYAHRRFLGRATDIGVRADGGRILAGVSYCYRQIRSGADAPIDVCVLSAGTTLRSERGRGHYGQLLATGLELCRARSYAAILGFVTQENGSGRGLQRLGAYSIPSYYIVSRGRPASRGVVRRPPVPSRVPDFAGIPHAGDPPHPDGQVHFHYPGRQDWISQFIRRPNPVRALRASHDATAILETVNSTDRLQWLGCPAHKVIASLATLATASAAADRTFFMYTLDPLLAKAALRLGLSLRKGWLLLLPVDRARADWRALAEARWSVQSGDRL